MSILYCCFIVQVAFCIYIDAANFLFVYMVKGYLNQQYALFPTDFLNAGVGSNVVGPTTPADAPIMHRAIGLSTHFDYQRIAHLLATEPLHHPVPHLQAL